MAHRVYADRVAVQNEVVPYLLQEIVTLMKLGVRNSDHLNDLILFLDDLHITNVMIKEHLFILSMDKKLHAKLCLLYTSPSPRDRTRSRMPSSA